MKPAEDYIINQPEFYRDILLNLQVGIENAIPELELLYKWRIPSRGSASVGDLLYQMYRYKNQLPSTKPTYEFA
jgi:hypothetical protein